MTDLLNEPIAKNITPVARLNIPGGGQITVQDGLAFERPLNDLQTKIDELRSLNTGSQLELQGEIELLEDRLKRQTAEVYAGLSPWERVNVARHADRPLTSDYVSMMLDDFVELHGDRVYGDDRAIITGLATMGEHRFLLVGHRKGKTVKPLLLPCPRRSRRSSPCSTRSTTPSRPSSRRCSPSGCTLCASRPRPR